MAQIRSPGADLVSHVKTDLYACLMCDRRKMQHRIGRASESHVYSLSVVESSLCHDVARLDILLNELHDLHARFLGKPDPC